MSDAPGLTHNRAYRRLHRGAGLVYFSVLEGETDLHIGAERKLEACARQAASEARRDVIEAIRRCPSFVTSLTPVALNDALPVAQTMLNATRACGVGPMAAVAGAIAQHVGKALVSAHDGDVIVENGGDIYLRCASPRVMMVYAGNSPLSNRLGLRITAPSGCGVCTSAGKVGPSLSFGRADAAVMLADDAALADACATAAGNLVNGEDGVQRAATFASQVPGLRGALIICDDKMAAWGDIELVRLG